MEKIDKKFKELKKEIEWRMKNKDYKESDKEQVCVHETIDKEVSFMSNYDRDKLIDELGIEEFMRLEADYLDNYGDIESKDMNKRLRLILYWYFERRYFDELT